MPTPRIEECALHDRGQLAAIIEQLEAKLMDLKQAAEAALIVPVEIDPDVPQGTIRIRYDDGTTRDVRII